MRKLVVEIENHPQCRDTDGKENESGKTFLSAEIGLLKEMATLPLQRLEEFVVVLHYVLSSPGQLVQQTRSSSIGLYLLF